MKIVVFGARGRIGERIVQEALSRGHDVIAVIRDADKAQQAQEHFTIAAGDAANAADVARVAAGADVVVSAVGPSPAHSPTFLSDAAHALLEGMRQAGAQRLLIVGGAGSLEVAPGQHLLDSPEFNPAWRPTALAHRDALNVYRAEKDLNWTYLSPADQIFPGERTGHYRTGGDQLLRDAEGHSRISMEDYAVALVDEIEQPKHPRQRFTVAY